jgi:hypothetical protein
MQRAPPSPQARRAHVQALLAAGHYKLWQARPGCHATAAAQPPRNRRAAVT